ncbi:MAG: hypothetical protein AB1546_06395 [bacterium]
MIYCFLFSLVHGSKGKVKQGSFSLEGGDAGSVFNPEPTEAAGQRVGRRCLLPLVMIGFDKSNPYNHCGVHGVNRQTLSLVVEARSGDRALQF